MKTIIKIGERSYKLCSQNCKYEGQEKQGDLFGFFKDLINSNNKVAMFTSDPKDALYIIPTREDEINDPRFGYERNVIYGDERHILDYEKEQKDGVYIVDEDYYDIFGWLEDFYMFKGERIPDKIVLGENEYNTPVLYDMDVYTSEY